MADSTIKGALAAENKRILIETPLACPSGNTAGVSVVLRFLATRLRAGKPDEPVDLCFDDCCGLAHLLETCASALDSMDCDCLCCSEGGE